MVNPGEQIRFPQPPVLAHTESGKLPETRHTTDCFRVQSQQDARIFWGENSQAGFSDGSNSQTTVGDNFTRPTSKKGVNRY